DVPRQRIEIERKVGAKRSDREPKNSANLIPKGHFSSLDCGKRQRCEASGDKQSNGGDQRDYRAACGGALPSSVFTASHDRSCIRQAPCAPYDTPCTTPSKSASPW